VDLPDPHPGPGEVRIAVRAAGIRIAVGRQRKQWFDGSNVPLAFVKVDKHHGANPSDPGRDRGRHPGRPASGQPAVCAWSRTIALIRTPARIRL